MLVVASLFEDLGSFQVDSENFTVYKYWNLKISGSLLATLTTNMLNRLSGSHWGF